MMHVENLVFEYPGKRVLKDISFEIEKGSITALVGPNGAGKTTLMRCLAALDEPFSGRITLDGIDTREEPRKIHRKIGYLSDFFGLYDDLTVRQCLFFIASIHKIPTSDIEEKIKRSADYVNISDYLGSKAGELSRGLRQRLAIAQALIHEPEVLILDEPASGLDPEARMSLSKLFLGLQERGITMLISSHILAELEDYCNDMLLIRGGNIVSHTKSFDNNAEDINIIEIMVTGAADMHLQTLRNMENIRNACVSGDKISLEIAGTKEDISRLLQDMVHKGIALYHFAVKKRKLQDIYMQHADGGADE